MKTELTSTAFLLTALVIVVSVLALTTASSEVVQASGLKAMAAVTFGYVIIRTLALSIPSLKG